jgi:hypothetical protein
MEPTERTDSVWPHSENLPDTTPSRPGRLEPLLFVATLIVATLLYLVTKRPALAVILPCLHGGWETFRTGLWVLQSDPCRPRARTCFAFYLAAACWKSAASAFLAVVIFIVAAMITGFQPNINEFAATMFVLAGGVVLNMFLGLGAICAALRQKIRVWVHPRLRAMTDGDLRRVAELGPVRRGANHAIFGLNHAIFVVATALAFPVAGAGALAVAILTVGKNRNQLETVPATIFLCLTLFGAPLATIPGYVWLSLRIVARSPQECWPELTSGSTP